MFASEAACTGCQRGTTANHEGAEEEQRELRREGGREEQEERLLTAEAAIEK